MAASRSVAILQRTAQLGSPSACGVFGLFPGPPVRLCSYYLPARVRLRLAWDATLRALPLLHATQTTKQAIRGPSTMKREAGGPCLSAVFVDYDNIYLSLKRKSEEAAKRFAKDASGWLRGIETGRLITRHQRPVRRRPAAHRHEPLLRQPRAAPQHQRQLHRHELVPVRAPPLPARRIRGDRLPAAHRPAQELLRHPHGHGYP